VPEVALPELQQRAHADGAESMLRAPPSIPEGGVGHPDDLGRLS
jgi:hypothetical protein